MSKIKSTIDWKTNDNIRIIISESQIDLLNIPL